jgi:hypothetical protein
MLQDDGLLPPGLHVVTEQQFRDTFVNAFPPSSSRHRLFLKWQRHKAAISSIITIEKQWIDGSFVTDRPNPRDVDVVNFILADDIDKLALGQQALLENLVSGHDTRDVWGIDSFLVPAVLDGDPRRPLVKQQEDYWLDLFSRVRDNDSLRKGFLEVAG